MLSVAQRSVIVAEWKLPSPRILSNGISLHTASIRCTPANMFDMRLNSHSRLNLIGALIEAIDAGADEALMLDPHGFRIELQCHELFVVSRGTVMTSKGEFCFNGVTRSNVIKLCQQNRRASAARLISRRSRRAPRMKRSSPAHSAASHRCGKSTVACFRALARAHHPTRSCAV